MKKKPKQKFCFWLSVYAWRRLGFGYKVVYFTSAKSFRILYPNQGGGSGSCFTPKAVRMMIDNLVRK